MHGPFPERPAVGLLANKSDRARFQVTSERLESLRAAGKVPGTEIARTGCRARRRVRDAEAERQQLELLGRLKEVRCESGCVQKAPEVVAGVRKVRVGQGREVAGIDAAEDDLQPGGKDIGYRRGWLFGGGYAASGSRASRRASNASRMRSVSADGDSVTTESSGRTTLTVSSLPLWP